MFCAASFPRLVAFVTEGTAVCEYMHMYQHRMVTHIQHVQYNQPAVDFALLRPNISQLGQVIDFHVMIYMFQGRHISGLY